MTEVSGAPDRAQSVSDDFFAAAFQRIVRILLFLLPCLVLLFWTLFNHRFAMGFLVGGAIAIVNLLSLKKLVTAFAERMIVSGGRQRSSGLVLRFVLRYGFIAAAGYAIFRSSAMSAYGLLAGLAIPAIAIMIEAGYELYESLRRGY